MSTTSTVPLLLLPGLLTDARMWQPQVDGLAGIADCTIADLGKSDSIAAMADTALAAAPEGRFALAGFSMGGYVALEIMRRAPERVRALALLDTSARPDTPEGSEGRKKIMARAETDYMGVVNDLLPKFILPARLRDAALVDVFMAMARDLGKDVFIRQQQAIMGRIDSRPLLDAIHCPTLVLCGRDDPITPPEVHEEMAGAIRGARHVVVEECAHLSTLGQPLQVTSAMQTWLTGIPR